jgi:hypothetical protein
MAAEENADYERAITVRRSAGRLRYLRERQASLSNRCATSDGFYLVRHGRKGGKTITGRVAGTDGQHQKTEEVLCQEYILQSDRLIFRIRPRDDKHPVLLPIGELAQFRIHKDKLLLRVPESDGKEREYIVVFTSRADDPNSSNQGAPKLAQSR